MTLTDGFRAVRGVDNEAIVPVITDALAAICVAAPRFAKGRRLQRAVTQAMVAVYGAGYARGIEAGKVVNEAMKGEG